MFAYDVDQFFVTHDRRYTSPLAQCLENHLRLRTGSVLHCDSINHRTVAEGIQFANGVAYDAHRQLLYVASMLSQSVLVMRYDADRGVVQKEQEFAVATGIDNLNFGEGSYTLATGHPKPPPLARSNANPDVIAPSEAFQVLLKEKGHIIDKRVFYRSEGDPLHSSSTAADLNGITLIGSLFDNRLAVCEF